mmetsp:Transcript_12923/g.21872  ORF Transcript_12923/g.21872 Transcript_12923/m.21872 type:complete len:283 (+) Transcript_12923:1364-2212(+)
MLDIILGQVGLLGAKGVGNLLHLGRIALLPRHELVDDLAALGPGLVPLEVGLDLLLVLHVHRARPRVPPTRLPRLLATADDALGPGGAPHLRDLLLRQLDRTGVPVELNLLDSEGLLALEASDVNEALDVDEVVLDVAAHHQLLALLVGPHLLGHHVGAVISPGDVGGEGDRDLAQEGVDVGLKIERVDRQELVLARELGLEVAKEQSLHLRLPLARGLLKVLQHSNERHQALGSEQSQSFVAMLIDGPRAVVGVSLELLLVDLVGTHDHEDDVGDLADVED